MSICSIADTGKLEDLTTHPLRSRAKVLLTSVFGPYAQDDDYGSRAINPMELWHNQVTRVQGAFSLRMFHRSWGLMLIQSNINAKCTCLDFPDLDRFIQEIRDNSYDVIGISAILPNLVKVEKMCELIRKHAPQAAIVVGGHIANAPQIKTSIDADHVVRGDGVRWFRAYLGEDENRPIRHPRIWSGFSRRTMGIDLPFNPGNMAAALIPSVGCPIGCNFCSTSAMFGGKGKFINFYETGDELFAVMSELADEMGVLSFFVMDENFLLHKKRAMRLLELMEIHDKAWSLNVFSSANALKLYTMDELVRLGVSWIWMGLEGKDSQYTKLHGTDTRAFVRELQSHGIRVLGSTIIGMEEHTPENIDEAIDYAADHDTDFHQFMLYTPIPGTPLYQQFTDEGRIHDELSEADVHGQYRFNFNHPNLAPGQETEFLLRAFKRDFDVNGPSVIRAVRTAIKGWKKHKNHPDPRVRRRYAWEVEGVPTFLAGSVWAASKFYKDNPAMKKKMTSMLEDIYSEFGLTPRLVAPVLGTVMLRLLRMEVKRLAHGWTYEPPTFYETNHQAITQPAGNPTAPSSALRWLGKTLVSAFV